MEILKTTQNLTFDVIYADGTRKRVEEGVLWEAENEQIICHLGTSSLSVLFASVEDALTFVDLLGMLPLLSDYLSSAPESKAFGKLVGIAGSSQNRALFRLGQMDMRDAAARMLQDLADGTQGVVCATLIDAAEQVAKLEILDG